LISVPFFEGGVFVGWRVDLDMIRYILLLLLIGLVYWSCENAKEEESTIIISKVFGENDVWLIKTDSEGNTEPYSEK